MFGSSSGVFGGVIADRPHTRNHRRDGRRRIARIWYTAAGWASSRCPSGPHHTACTPIAAAIQRRGRAAQPVIAQVGDGPIGGERDALPIGIEVGGVGGGRARDGDFFQVAQVERRSRGPASPMPAALPYTSSMDKSGQNLGRYYPDN